MRKAFTLIELLVVIAIIAILAAMLMPSLEKAKELASQTSCMARMRNMSLSMVEYENDFQHYMCLTGYWDDDQQDAYKAANEDDQVIPGPEGNNPKLWCVKLANWYLPVADMFFCDAYYKVHGTRIPVGRESEKGEAECMYGDNWHFTRESPWGAEWKKQIRVTELTSPGEQWMIGHVYWLEFDPKCFDSQTKRSKGGRYWSGVHVMSSAPMIYDAGRGRYYPCGNIINIHGDHHVEYMDWWEGTDYQSLHYAGYPGIRDR